MTLFVPTPPTRCLTIIESPYAGNISRNLAYARAAVSDSIHRGEVPFASHLFYTQPGILDDDVPEERTLGMLTGFRFYDFAVRCAVYEDFGISGGMQTGMNQAAVLGIPVVHRRLDGFHAPIHPAETPSEP